MKSTFLISLALAGVSNAPPTGSRYVSMGSSYAAGPGVGILDPASGACARSQSNYARQVARERNLGLVDVSCSGATTGNILLQGQHGFPAQVEAVTPDTRFVSVLIGGNDVAYVGNLMSLSCRNTGGSDCHITVAIDVERRFNALPAALDRVIAEVRHRAPNTMIILVDYLPTLPAAGPSSGTALALTAADVAQMRAVAAHLAQVIGDAATRNSTGIIRSSMIGAGHDACSAKPYVSGSYPRRNPSWPSPVAYHPTQAGMDRIVAELLSAVDA